MKSYDIYILTIYSQKSITKAANIIGISQPALSSALSSLEEKLGYRIFDRSKSPLLPTKAGRIYIEYLQQKRELELNLKNKLSEIDLRQNLTLNVGAPASYIETRIIPAISEFIKHSSDVNFVITEGTVSFLEQKMQNGELDLFLSTNDTATNDFKCEQIGTEQTFVCVPSDSKFSTLKAIHLCDIKDESFVLLHPQQPLQQLVDNSLANNNLILNSTIRVDQVSSAIKFVEMGNGFCFATNNSIPPNDKVKLIPLIDEQILSRNLYAVVPTNRFVPTHHQHFIDILKSQEERNSIYEN